MTTVMKEIVTNPTTLRIPEEEIDLPVRPRIKAAKRKLEEKRRMKEELSHALHDRILASS